MRPRTVLLPLAFTTMAVTSGCTTGSLASPTAADHGLESEAATVSPSAEATDSANASPSSEPSGSASGEPNASEGPLGDAQSCENEDIGFSVDYPEAWWANDRVEATFEGGTPIPACTYFAPEPVELRPNAGLPGGIHVWFDVETQFEVTGERLSEEETTVDGFDALVVESEATRGGFTPEGTLTYLYLIDMPDGRQVIAQASTYYVDEGEYEDAKPILDAMMESLDLDE